VKAGLEQADEKENESAKTVVASMTSGSRGQQEAESPVVKEWTMIRKLKVLPVTSY